MSHDKWYNKGEVLTDLGQVSGRCRGDGLRHVTDRPPAVAAGDDDEMKELLRRFGRRNSVRSEQEGPDLAYIADLISQARQYDNHIPDYSQKLTTDTIEQKALVISKPSCRLDPSVPEFQPRKASNSFSNPKVEDNAKTISKKSTRELSDRCNISSKVTSDRQEAVEGLNMGNDNGKILSDNKSNVEKTAEDLKRIIITPTANTVESKVKRNAALMSLMRLYATQSPVPLQEKEMPVQSGSEVKPVKAEVPEKKVEAPVKNIDEASPQQIEESIRKVDQWLSGPTKEAAREVKAKTPFTAQLKPFTYKKKEKASTSNCESQSLVASASSSQSPTQGSTSKKYVPSKYAEELYKEFEKQREKRHVVESRDKTLWGYIEKGIYDNKHS